MLAEAAGPDQPAARKMRPGHCTKKIHPGSHEVTFLGTDTSFAQSHLASPAGIFRGARISSLPREEIRAPLKMPAGEAKSHPTLVKKYLIESNCSS